MNSINLQDAAKALEIENEISCLTSGQSMKPLFRQHKDIAVIRKKDRALKKGDVVLYKYPEREEYILHRVIGFKGEAPVIRGDNNTFTEYGVKNEYVIGILTAFYRNGVYFECEKSVKYKLYVFALKAIYPINKIKRLIIRIFSKLKSILIGT